LGGVELRRLGIGFTGVPYSVRQVADLAKEAEVSGFESVWIAEDYFLRDAVTMLTGVAFSTNSIKLGTGVVNPYTRNPVLIAQTLATLDEVSGGRAFLALGTGVGPLIEQTGVKFEKPLQRLRESVETVRALLSGEELTFEGKALRVDRVRLGENPYFELLGRFKPLRGKIPIYVAAIGPKMLEVAGEIADGVLLTAGCSPDYVMHAAKHVRAGAERAGRDYGTVDVAAFILTSLSDGPRERLGLKGFIAYGLTYASGEYLASSRVSDMEVEPIRRAFLERGMKAGAELVTDSVLNKFSACGDISNCVSRIEQYVEAGVKLPVVLPVETDTSKLISALGRFALS